MLRCEQHEILMRSVQVSTSIPQQRQTTSAICVLSKKQFRKKPSNILGGRVVHYVGVVHVVQVLKCHPTEESRSAGHPIRLEAKNVTAAEV